MDEQAVENDTLTSLVDEATPELGEGEYFLTEGIKGSGDAPEWYRADKYKSIADQARGYSELEKRFGGFKGAPKDGYQAPENVDEDDALYEELKTFAQDTNMSQDAFGRAWELLSTQTNVANEVSVEAEISKLGDNAQNRIKTVEQFMKNNLDAETYDKVRHGVNTAESVELIEALINATSPAKLPIDGYVQPGGVTWEAIESLMFEKDENGHLKRSVDRSHEAKIQKMMQEFGGGRPHKQQMG
tara:strand:- start:2594 stop:3325 length:732 start_codon:yes stop_codon:yes gene_type:complete